MGSDGNIMVFKNRCTMILIMIAIFIYNSVYMVLQIIPCRDVQC